MSYILCTFGGFLFGVVITCILLAKKNLERYEKMSKAANETMKNNIDMAKGTYNAYLSAHGVGKSERSKDHDDIKITAFSEET